MAIAGNKWKRHFVLVEVTTLGATTKDVVAEVARMIDKSLPQLDATQVGRVEVKDLRKAKRAFEQIRIERIQSGITSGRLSSGPNPLLAQQVPKRK